MFCKNCGKQIDDKAVICVGCGVPVKTGASVTGSGEGKDWLTALLLSIFLGIIGVHRFYTGHMAIGVVQLFTFGGCGIWSLIDIIMIASGKFKDADGNLLVKK